jgi:formate/nitrite transporter
MDPASHFDSLLPREIAQKAEATGVAKANLDFISTLLLAMLAGAFIALGAVFSTVAISGSGGALPFGIARIVAGITFSLGLILVVVAGAELFTGNNLLLMAFASGKVPFTRVLRNWAIVFVGNFIGAVLTAGGMMLAGLHTLGNGEVGKTALAIANGKCALDLQEALARGIFCNALVCLAVWLCMSCRSTGDKILAILFPVTAFVAAGFEHSVANMYFVPFALMVKQSATPEFWTSITSHPAAHPNISWATFAVTLIPVTFGNIVGGGVLVGVVYWVIYGRRATA